MFREFYLLRCYYNWIPLLIQHHNIFLFFKASAQLLAVRKLQQGDICQVAPQQVVSVRNTVSYLFEFLLSSSLFVSDLF